MSVIDFSIDHPENIPTKPLGEVEKDLVSATVGFTPELPSLGGIGFKLSASANGKVEAYNDKSDTDEDGVLGTAKESEDPFGPVVLPPQIDLNDQSAWLKYRFQAGVTASAEAKVLKHLAFKVDTGVKVVFADYRVHGRDDITAMTALGDATKLRFVGRADDAFSLAANEALYYQVRGEFSAKVTLSWSDVFTFGLTEIASALQNNELLMLKVDTSASLDFHVGIVDDFQLVLTKGTGTKVRVALKKGKSREVGVSAGVDVGAEFANPEQLEQYLNTIYEAVLGQPLNKVKALLDRPEAELNRLISELPDAAQKLIAAVLDRLKINSGLQTLKDFKEQIEKIETTIKDTIKEIAKAKVKLSFKYEYLRVSTDDTLFVVQLDREKFKEFHNELMLCDFINVLDWARKPENKTAVERFLNQKTIATTESWGFTLGIGKWKFFGTDTKEQKAIVQTDIDGKNRIAYRFLRKYDASFGEKFSWTVDFKAEMDNFVANPSACDFECGLHFARTAEDKFDDDDMRRVFDDALIWQSVSVQGLADTIAKIEAENLLGKKAKAVTQFIIKDATLKKLLPLVEAADNDTLMAQALAMAMVYDDRFKTRSENLNDRQRVYEPLWKRYFAEPNLEGGSYAMMAANFIRNQQMSDAFKLAEFEKGTGLPAGQPVFTMRLETFSGAIHFHHKSNVNSTINDFRKNFINGLTTLNRITKNCQPHTGFKEAFEDMRPFFTQSLYVRAAGVYLIRLAARNQLLGEISRSCTVAYPDKTFAFGKGDQ
jgi:hypothetical protein